jgi:hypothetical protein
MRYVPFFADVQNGHVWLHSRGEGNTSGEDDPNKHSVSSEAERWQPHHWASSARRS